MAQVRAVFSAQSFNPLDCFYCFSVRFDSLDIQIYLGITYLSAGGGSAIFDFTMWIVQDLMVAKSAVFISIAVVCGWYLDIISFEHAYVA